MNGKEESVQKEYDFVGVLVNELIGLGCTYFQKNKKPLGEERIEKIVKSLMNKLYQEDSKTLLENYKLVNSALTKKEIKDLFNLINKSKLN